MISSPFACKLRQGEADRRNFVYRRRATSWRTLSFAVEVASEALSSRRPGRAAVTDVSANDFDRLFNDALTALRPLADQDPTAERDPTVEQDRTDEPIRGVGEAMDGFVRVTATPGGQLERVELNPRVMRSDSESLAQAFVAASNAALADLQQKISATLPPLADQQQLLERLQEFQSQSVSQMQRYLKAITDVQDRIDRD
nr:YbaB/EbfC family nucleoid-associated protein [Actinopolymorpha pittospori]